MDTDKITDRDKQDYGFNLHPNKARTLMQSEQALLDDGSISQDDYDEALYKNRQKANKHIVIKICRVMIYRNDVWFSLILND